MASHPITSLRCEGGDETDSAGDSLMDDTSHNTQSDQLQIPCEIEGTTDDVSQDRNPTVVKFVTGTANGDSDGDGNNGGGDDEDGSGRYTSRSVDSNGDRDGAVEDMGNSMDKSTIAEDMENSVNKSTIADDEAAVPIRGYSRARHFFTSPPEYCPSPFLYTSDSDPVAI
uniref:Sodium channel protein type 4 subunit alpha B n=1 Tax=Lygus hesperus TaxID=30085 RepID=A0A0A9ZC32_LYGHE